MITSAQLRAARALLGVDQRTFAAMAGLSLPTIQRMEVSDGQVRGVIDTLVKVMDALDSAGIELIADDMVSVGTGRGVRLKQVAGKVIRHKGIDVTKRRAEGTSDVVVDSNG